MEVSESDPVITMDIEEGLNEENQNVHEETINDPSDDINEIQDDDVKNETLESSTALKSESQADTTIPTLSELDYARDRKRILEICYGSDADTADTQMASSSEDSVIIDEEKPKQLIVNGKVINTSPSTATMTEDEMKPKQHFGTSKGIMRSVAHPPPNSGIQNFRMQFFHQQSAP